MRQENTNQKKSVEAVRASDKELSRLNRILETLYQCNHALVHATDEDELFQSVCEILVEVGGLRLAWVGCCEDDAEKTVRPVAKAGYGVDYLEKVTISWSEETEWGRGPTGIALRTGKPCWVKDTRTDPILAPWRTEATARSYASCVALPLIAHGERLGSLSLAYVERAIELAQFGLAEARRTAFSLQPTIIEELGLVQALQKLVERSNIPGRLRCNFRSTGVPEESLPPSAQEDLLRIAQEAMSNAVRHAKPTVINVSLRCDPPNLVLEITDNGSGIADPQTACIEGFGLSNMQARAEKLGAQFDVRTAPGRGTGIVVHMSM